MAKNFSNVKDYKVVANNGFQFNVDVYGVNNLGNKKWMLRAVEVISEYFTFTEGADEGLIVNVIVNTNRIIVKAEFNGKEYLALPIQPKYGKNQIKDILDDMGVIKDVIDVYTNNLVNNKENNNKMEDNNMANDVMNIEEMVLDFNDYVLNTLMNDYENVVGEAEVYAEDYGEYYTESQHLSVTMEYDYDIEKMWVNWAWGNDVMKINDAYDYYRANMDRFITNEELDAVLEGLDGTDDVGYGECLVWVVNPFYVAEDMVKNDAPCLVKVCPNFDNMVNGEDVESGFGDDFWDEDDIKRVADTIENYLKNYTPSYLDQFGDCVISIYWDNFNEEDYDMLVEDKIFAKYVEDMLRERGIIKNSWDFLVDDENDTVDVTVDYNKMFNKVA